MRKNFGAKSWFYPLPVLIIGTYDDGGNPDAMNAAWGGLYDADKVVLCLSTGHKTTKNIQSKGAFTVSFADAAHVIPADYVGLVSANNEPEKMKKSGFHTTKSEFVDAPLIDELPVALECKFLKMTEDGNIVGQIVNVSIDEGVLSETGDLDMKKFKPISFDPANNGYHVLGERIGNAFHDGSNLK
ncbi:flavoredoxin [[Clostridium] methylpentosum DSM 5476]|jgi:flavin reductase (DIM6/NTAB) family NADH-FMN oxidoreductase RutF|uniref:Flavoredoxin n=1 Tax=[Clostridium] methylpentosum DSM 5476 TaxID=537013 RepID=C0EAU1_9FIRM|nr:flavoredoxin [[Clostridium] methylpentosum DSM 5476]MDY3989370.1 flavin reductase [Massilioclostridium sp.]MEE1492364.1 flavin reductase [Massilioclostridium sp.]